MGRGGKQKKWSDAQWQDAEAAVSQGDWHAHWPVTYSPQRPWKASHKDGEKTQSAFPSYQSMAVTDDKTAGKATGKGRDTVPVPGSVQGLQPLLTLARKAELRVLKLQQQRDRAQQQWAAYDQEMKQAFLREKQRFRDNQNKLSTEIEAAQTGQEQARQAVYLAFLGQIQPVTQPMEEEDDDWERTREQWEKDASFDSEGVLQRALAQAQAAGLGQPLTTRPIGLPQAVANMPAPSGTMSAPVFGSKEGVTVLPQAILQQAATMGVPPGLGGEPYSGPVPASPFLPAPGSAFFKAPPTSLSPSARLNPYDLGKPSAPAAPEGAAPPSLEERVRMKRSALQPFGLPAGGGTTARSEAPPTGTVPLEGNQQFLIQETEAEELDAADSGQKEPGGLPPGPGPGA